MLDDQTINKRIWIGKPLITTKLEPSYNSVEVNLIGGNNTKIITQGITSTTWQKISNSGQCTPVFKGSGFNGFAFGNCYNWSVQVKITARNSCGTTTIYRTIVPPPAPPCDDNYRLIISPNPNKGANLTLRIAPIDPCYEENPFMQQIKNKVQIYDMYGTKKYRGIHASNDISITNLRLKKGVYIVHFTSANGVKKEKMLMIE